MVPAFRYPTTADSNSIKQYVGKTPVDYENTCTLATSKWDCAA
jgi:hypothetical protein